MGAIMSLSSLLRELQHVTLLLTLLDMLRLVPQDTVAVQELRFGDNDTLSAQVATLVEADYLFLLTDVDALYTANPKVLACWLLRTVRSTCMPAPAYVVFCMCLCCNQ